MNIKQQEINEYANETVKITTTVLAVFLLAIMVIWMAVQYAETSFSRDVDNWNIRMSVTADIRKDNIDRWLEAEQKEIHTIADNTSLRLYLSELQDTKAKGEGDADNQSVFLRNYILSTAAKNGYIAPAMHHINANFVNKETSGLFLLNNAMKVIVGTAGEEVFSKEIQNFVANLGSKKGIYDLQFLSNRLPVMAFISPVFGIQGEESEGDHIGYVVGVKNVEDVLYPALYSPTVNEKTAETYLVRGSGAELKSFQYLSPIADKRIVVGLGNNFPVKSELVDVNSTALREPHATMKMGRDFTGSQVLYVTRKIDGLPWVLIHKVDRHEALAESDQRRFGVISISVLFIVVISLFILALWRHASSLKYQKLATKFRSQERLLRLVADNVPDAMYIVDTNHELRFANKSAADEHRTETEELVGKSILSIIPPKVIEEYEGITSNVLQQMSKEVHVRTTQPRRKNESSRTISSTYIPLERIPRVLKGEVSSGVLVVDHDITDIVTEKEKKERTLKELVNVIIKLVDGRDSYTAKHSERVALLGQNIAREMQLSDVEIDTVFITGEIMNIGKILLPKTILNKKEKLSAKERDMVQDAILKSASLVESIDFEGPVVETLRQTYERFDGEGVLGLKEEEILITARILHVANACVAMLSNRSYRKMIAYEDIVAIFMSDEETRYDRKVVVALIAYMEKNMHIVKSLQG